MVTSCCLYVKRVTIRNHKMRPSGLNAAIILVFRQTSCRGCNTNRHATKLESACVFRNGLEATLNFGISAVLCCHSNRPCLFYVRLQLLLMSKGEHMCVSGFVKKSCGGDSVQLWIYSMSGSCTNRKTVKI